MVKKLRQCGAHVDIAPGKAECPLIANVSPNPEVRAVAGQHAKWMDESRKYFMLAATGFCDVDLE